MWVMEMNKRRDYHRVDEQGNITSTITVVLHHSDLPADYHLGWGVDEIFIEPIWIDGYWIESKTEEEIEVVLDKAEENLRRVKQEKPITISSFNSLILAVRTILKQVDLTDDQMLGMIEIYTDWEKVEDGTKLSESEYYKYKDKLYQVRDGKGHLKQEDWMPDISHSEFRQVLPEGVVPIWYPERGYELGEQVTHNDYVWTSKQPGNVAEPGADKEGGYRFWTKEIDSDAEEPEVEEITDWIEGTEYIIGQRVKYKDKIYESTHAHNTWAPTEWSVWKKIDDLK